MDPVTMSALIGAGSSIFGGILGSSGTQATNAQSYAMMMQQEQFNAQQSQIQRDWQTEMSNTAYQRQMADMKAAGLNPILAAGQGGGAPVPSGATASIGGTPSLGNPGESLSKGIAGAGQAAMATTAMQAQKAQAEKDKSAVNVNDSTVKLNDAAVDKTKQEERTSKSAERLNDAAVTNKAVEAVKMAADANSANSVARVNTRIAEDTERYGDSPYSKAIGGVVRMLRTGNSELVQPTAKKVQDAITAPGSYPNGIRGYDNGIMQKPTSLKLPAR